MFKPQINVTVGLGRNRKNNSTPTVEEPTPDYVKLAEEAASRLGKKLVIGAVVVVATTIVLSTLSQITVNALDTTTSN